MQSYSEINIIYILIIVIGLVFFTAMIYISRGRRKDVSQRKKRMMDEWKDRLG